MVKVGKCPLGRSACRHLDVCDACSVPVPRLIVCARVVAAGKCPMNGSACSFLNVCNFRLVPVPDRIFCLRDAGVVYESERSA